VPHNPRGRSPYDYVALAAYQASNGVPGADYALRKELQNALASLPRTARHSVDPVEFAIMCCEY